jgi:hypothetical protein
MTRKSIIPTVVPIPRGRDSAEQHTMGEESEFCLCHMHMNLENCPHYSSDGFCTTTKFMSVLLIAYTCVSALLSHISTCWNIFLVTSLSNELNKIFFFLNKILTSVHLYIFYGLEFYF